jgi:hypothetical protein
MLIDSSLIKLPVGGHETDDWTFDKVNLRISDRHVLSFAQNIIYDVTHCKVKTPKGVGLSVLLKGLAGSAELVKVP